MDHIGKAKNSRNYQTPKPYDRRKSLLGRVSDSVKEILAPSWLVDLVQSVKKKTPPQTPQEQSYSTYSPDNQRQIPGVNVYPSSNRQQTYSGPENGMSQERTQFNSAMYSMPLGHRDHQQFSQAQQYGMQAGTRDQHQYNVSQPGGRDIPHFSNPMGGRDMIQFNQQSAGREMGEYNNPSQFSIPGSSPGQQEPVQFTSENLPFGSMGKMNISSSMLVNGADDQSELSEFAASGCVMDKKDCDKDINRIHQMRQEYGGSVTPSKEIEERGIPANAFHSENNSHSLSERSFLWSGEVKPGHCSSPQPPAKRYKPSFNMSLFGSSMPSPDKDGTFHDSSYYPGKTTFGGAASHRKNRPKQATPRQMTPNRKQVQAKPLNQSVSGVTSSTARKILDSLERMSTPLKDAKKIPSYNSSIADSPLSFTPGVYRRRSFAGRTSHSGPPVQGISSPTHATVTRNLQKAPTSNSTASLQRFAMTQAGKTSSGGFSGTFDGGQTSTAPPTTMVFGSKDNEPSKARSGKMKRERSTFHTSKRTTEEEEEEIEVPDLPTTFTLPVSNFPKIDFGSEGLATGPSFSKSKELARPPIHSPTKAASDYKMENSGSTNGMEVSSAVTSGEFAFSIPIAKGSPSIGVSEMSPQKFTFSSPINAGEENNRNPSTTLIPVMELHTTPNEPVLKKRQQIPKSEEAFVASPFKPATELKTGSVMDFLKKSTGPVTIDSEKSKDVNTGFGNQFQPPTNNWSYPTCMVSNKAELTMCPCCNASKPVASVTSQKSSDNVSMSVGTSAVTSSAQQGGLFAKPGSLLSYSKPSNKWDCPTCMVSNDNTMTKCPCCETLKPAAKGKSDSAEDVSKPVLSEMFKAKADTWECGICMIRNNVALAKCAACNGPKPVTNSGQTTSVLMSDKPLLSTMFQKPTSNWDCDTCMVSNKPDSMKCIACDMPKPGLKTTTSFTSPGGFKIGATETKSLNEANSTVPPMKFGAFGNDKPIVGGEIKFGSTVLLTESTSKTSIVSTVTFGATNKDSTETKTSGLPTSFMFGSKVTKEDSSKPENSAKGGIKFGNLDNVSKSESLGVPSSIIFGKTNTSDNKSDNSSTNSFNPAVGSYKFESSIGSDNDKKEVTVELNKDNNNVKPVGGYTFSSSQQTSSQAMPVASLFSVSTPKTSENTSTVTKVQTGIFSSTFPTITSNETAKTEGETKPTSQPSIFGSAVSSSTVGGFGFSTPKPSEASSTAVNSTGGLFSTPQQTEQKKEEPKAGLFTFGQTATIKTDSKADSSSAGFAFKPSESKPLGTKPDSSAGGFSFKPSIESKPGGAFGFGTTTSSTTALPQTSASLFAFGKTTSGSTVASSENVGLGVKRERQSNESEAAKKEKTGTQQPALFGSSGSSGFNFTQSGTTSASSGFGGFGSSGTAPTFGSAAATNPMSGAPAFGSGLSAGGSSLPFGSTKATASTSITAFNSTPSFNFGTPGGASSTPATSNGGSAGSSLFEFGGGPAQTNNNNTGGAFVFGNSQPAAPAAPQPVQPAGFNFSAQSPAMNFGATQQPASGGAFQFSAGNPGATAGANPFSASTANSGPSGPRRPIKRAIRKIRK